MNNLNIIKDFEEIFDDAFPLGHKHFLHEGVTKQSIINPDQSRVDILSVNFNEWPLGGSKFEQDSYEIESTRFEKHFIETVQKVHQIELQALNDNHHYFCNNNGDTISVHFNDESLIYIETFTGQY